MAFAGCGACALVSEAHGVRCGCFLELSATKSRASSKALAFSGALDGSVLPLVGACQNSRRPSRLPGTSPCSPSTSSATRSAKKP
eukprot:7243690-Alexandrium_andersonii.AAC.1